ncbi:MAG: tetraacyldisaccharide 4'-kinase [Syntrophales bacterium LBB04]|nr:tetraacyldisaccharide 4'-kinase [Syntrophales bacterium LBB04]
MRKIWDGDCENRVLSLWYYFLIILELPYRFAIRARNYLYDKGIIETKKLSRSVISIGNIAVGGTGKTPAVIMLAQMLQKEGFKPAVLSRGYGGNSKKPVNIVSDGVNILAGYREVGDEPVLISQKILGIPVLTGKSRYAAGEIAINKFGADVLILDDGFQHRRLYRDIDIMLLDLKRPFGNGHLLPSGSLREFPDSISRAHIFLLTGSNVSEKDKKPYLVATLSKDQSNIFTSCHKPLDIRGGAGNRYYPLSILKGKRIYAFAGIGNPPSFCRTIKDLEAIPVGFLALSDHHNYSRRDILTIHNQARNAQADIILTTEKDAMRLGDYGNFLQEIFILRIELSLIPDSDAFINMIVEMLKMETVHDATTNR